MEYQIRNKHLRKLSTYRQLFNFCGYVLSTGRIKITPFLDVTPCCFVNGYYCTRRPRRRQLVPTKLFYLASTRKMEVTSPAFVPSIDLAGKAAGFTGTLLLIYQPTRRHIQKTYSCATTIRTSDFPSVRMLF